ncbi:AMP-dependent synthetase/ligase [Rhizosaccharibacter radicis]|uniref:Long-chain fatty acid--CoA ligase n=1 Tax=Rhizosaccharibacter radicis TaxID=2782605 RepID=A0ABT1VZ26_9PROT|nr:long-chain fatty acid--CoA ligase [Acetobacteraceae bacterium KSS12]
MVNRPDSLPALLLALADARPERPMLRFWQDESWQGLTCAQFARIVADVAGALRAKGIAAGDRVVIVSENRPEFLLAETALLSLRAVAVPTYTTNTVADHAHILRDSGARAAIVSTPVLAARIREAAKAAHGLSLLVLMDPPAIGTGAEAAEPPATPWRQLAEFAGDEARLRRDVAVLAPDDLACLIYTSGTGGLPKGVMLPHRCMLSNQDGVRQAVSRLKLDGERYLSFLPLSHSYEHTVGNYILPSLGMEVVYSRGADRIAAELREFSPAVVTAVPRLFEVLRARITGELERQPRWKRALFARALALGLRTLDGPALRPHERVAHRALDRLVGAKIRDRFGGRLVAMVSGGARLDPDLSGFFLALGVPVLQGYGQTEAGPVVSVNLPWDNDRRGVGRPLPGIEARCEEDGELLLRGELVMTGYWNDPEATARALEPAEEGGLPWLRTGDVATLEDGRIRVVDRKRDFIKLVSGEMVSPAKLESLLMAEPEIAQAVVAGEARHHVALLVVPAEDAGGTPLDHEAAIRRVNNKLRRFEQVRRWTTIPACTVENGLLTPTMKIKRRLVLGRYEDVVAGLF